MGSVTSLSTPYMVFSVTCYLELRCAINFYYGSHVLANCTQPYFKGLHTDIHNKGLVHIRQLLLSHHQAGWKCFINGLFSFTTLVTTLSHTNYSLAFVHLHHAYVHLATAQPFFSLKASKPTTLSPTNPLPTSNFTTSNSHIATIVSHE